MGRGKKLFFGMYLPSAVSPTTELEVALLVVKREPCNVYLAGALKDAWRDIEAAAFAVDDYVRLEGAVKLLIRAVVVVVNVVVVVVRLESGSSSVRWWMVVGKKRKSGFGW